MEEPGGEEVNGLKRGERGVDGLKRGVEGGRAGSRWIGSIQMENPLPWNKTIKRREKKINQPNRMRAGEGEGKGQL